MPSEFAIAVGELGEHCEHTVIGILIIENVRAAKVTIGAQLLERAPMRKRTFIAPIIPPARRQHTARTS